MDPQILYDHDKNYINRTYMPRVLECLENLGWHQRTVLRSADAKYQTQKLSQEVLYL